MRIKTALILLLLVAAITISSLSGHSAAATGEIYIVPSPSSVQIGGDTTISLRIRPGILVNAVQATINYDPAALEFLSSSVSAFPDCTVDSGGGGTVSLACAILAGNVSSDSLIANATFQALEGSGTTALSVTGANAADDGTWTNPSTSGTSVTLTSPAPAPPPSSSSGSSSHSSSSTTSKASGSTSTSTAPTSTTATQAPTTPTTTTTAPPSQVSISADTKKVEFNAAAIAVSRQYAIPVLRTVWH